MSKYRITLDGKTYEMEVKLISGDASINPVEKKESKEAAPTVKPAEVKPAQPAAPKPSDGCAGAVTAPMPGTVLRIEKKEGDAVKTGELVLILEAMKMENEILAPSDGTVTKMNCGAGSTVAGGEVLFEVG